MTASAWSLTRAANRVHSLPLQGCLFDLYGPFYEFRPVDPDEHPNKCSNYQPDLIYQVGICTISPSRFHHKVARTRAFRPGSHMSRATLHMLCGKIASGKSTLTAELSLIPSTVVISEDCWLTRLFGPEMNEIADYVRCSQRLRAVIGPHVQELLRLGVSVVLDFPANTLATRAWMKTLFEGAEADHCLHFLDVPDEVCKARLRARNAGGTHAFSASDAEFDLITSYFIPPSEAEGFRIVRR
jgi:predicted kinase